jgi:hypothetical protein
VGSDDQKAEAVNDLYAVIEGKPIVWSVVDFVEGRPRLVPVGRWVRPYEGLDPKWQPVPVTTGEVWVPSRGDTVVYAPTISDLINLIGPWIETEETTDAGA